MFESSYMLEYMLTEAKFGGEIWSDQCTHKAYWKEN